MLSVPTPNVSRWWLLGSRVNAGGPVRPIGDDNIRYRPFFVTRRVQIDQLGIVTDGTGGNTTLRLGIYTADVLGLPDVLLAETGDMNTLGDGSNTVKSGPIDLGSAELTPGNMYYVAIIGRIEGGGSDTDFKVVSIGSASGTLTLGGVSVAEALDELNDYSSIDHAATGWTSMPNPAAITSPTFSNMAPGIVGRVAAGYPGEGPGHAPFVYPWGPTAGSFGRWYTAGAIDSNSQVFALTSGSIAYMPFFVSRALDLDKMAFTITVADAGADARLAIFACDAVGKPGALLSETAEISCTPAGMKEADLGSVLTLAEKTNYWAAIGVSGGTPTIRMISQTSDTPGITNLGNSSAAAAGGNSLRDAHMAGVGFVSATGFVDETAATYTAAHLRQVAFRVSTPA